MDVIVVAEGEGQLAAASRVARRLGIPLADSPLASGRPPGDSVLLVQTAARLELREPGPAGPGPVAVEFRPGRGSPLLRRATLAGGGASRLVDATAGVGKDAFAMAEAGAQVELIERSELLAALLEDGLSRALEDPRCREAAGRMRLHVGDAAEVLPRLGPVDVVYLDPMYPRSGREGRKSKEMRLLREILGPDDDAERLLPVARSVAGRRVVVKRPLKAPPLGRQTPSGSLRGTTVRYDLYGPAGAERGGGEGNDER
jgi:16S rRNA (guanine1516-N2)-methyltransferase